MDEILTFLWILLKNEDTQIDPIKKAYDIQSQVLCVFKTLFQGLFTFEATYRHRHP